MQTLATFPRIVLPPASRRTLSVLLVGVLVSLVPGIADAQIADNLSAYTGDNAVGYLEPLVDALGFGLNQAWFTGGGVPRQGFRVRLDLRGMLVNYDDDKRTFQARTEPSFPDPQTVEAPTVIGSTEPVTVTDPGSGASYTFPGGLDLDRLPLAAPQLTVGSVLHTEAMVRYFTVETGDNEIGDITFLGLGVRHDFSRILGPLTPFHLSGVAFWQSLEIGDNLLDADAFLIGILGSRRFSVLEPYGGISWDTFALDATWETSASGQPEEITVSFDTRSTVHLTLGTALNLGIFRAHGEYHLSEETGFAFGLGIGGEISAAPSRETR